MEAARRLPDAEEALSMLAARFVHDPEFTVLVNGRSLAFHELEGKVAEARVTIDNTRSATVIVIDSTRVSHSSMHHGVAFWSQRRLVGDASWTIGHVAAFDGRTRFARRYNVIVDTEGFEKDVTSDWTTFRNNPPVEELYRRTAQEISRIAQALAAETVEESSADALIQNRSDFVSLGHGARIEVAEFTVAVARAHPTMAPEFLSAAVQAVINLEKSKSGAALLHKLAVLHPEDVEGLDRLLMEWTVKDALRVLDEIDGRLGVIDSIRRLARDRTADELHTLHPLVLRSRWIFGPEFESQEYCSNATLQTIARALFNKPDAKFVNEKNRPDVVVLPERTTCQLTGIEMFDPVDPALVRLQNVLLIELKKGDFEITRKEVTQADGYAQDIAASGMLAGKPFVCAWVVGETIARGTAREKDLRTDSGEVYARIRATTYGALVDTANRRLLRLRDALSNRYAAMPTDSLLNRVLGSPEQTKMDLIGASPPQAT
ncbi:MAG TPA: hypothetical protein VGD45_11775 [Steroidobacter sp.]|uniref:hypothetical protein n=1 Tax=Steroidobacter sp. TaxID=1978227 RepID=UPI002ED9AFF0